jgi:hypothetical protein
VGKWDMKPEEAFSPYSWRLRILNLEKNIKENSKNYEIFFAWFNPG